jgi:hypothetical protein
MTAAVAPTALPSPKKNSQFSVQLIATGFGTAGVSTVTWSVASGALPTFLSLRKIGDSGTGAGGVTSVAVVEGKVPATLDATTFTCTITATDGTNSASCTSTSVAKAVDGPDPEGYHGTEANRSVVVTPDQLDHGAGLSPADSIARMWPLTGPSQNS